MPHEERMLVKHSVTGRMLLSSTDGPVYKLDKDGEHFVIRFSGVSPQQAAEVLRHAGELNVFRFEEPEGGPVIKHWYYVGDQHVKYDEAESCLILTAGSEIEYRPDTYWE